MAERARVRYLLNSTPADAQGRFYYAFPAMKQLIYLLLTALLLSPGVTLAQYEVGDKARDFSLKNVDGKMVSMHGGPAHKGYVVVFFSNQCPFAQAYEQRLIALHRRYAPLGYPVVAINANDGVAQPEDSYPATQQRAADRAYPFPYLTDDTQQVARAFGAQRTPQLFVVKRYGSDYRVEYVGGVDDSPNDAGKVQQRYVEDALNALLAGQSVARSKTKPIGCAIRWKEL